MRRELVVCKDGFTMSVQASEYHYCSPREDNAEWYAAVEVGFPSEVEPLLMPHIDQLMESATQAVYPWTPAQVVMDVIEKHGGMVSGQMPPLNILFIVLSE